MRKKSSVLFTFTVFLLFLMSMAGFYSIYVTNTISTDAMVINRLGVIRGSMQRAVKLELNNKASDDVISIVDSTFTEFKSQKIRLVDHDNEVMDAISSVEVAWNQIKKAIITYRSNQTEENRLLLLEASEDGWYKANNMVLISQNLAEQKLSRFNISFVVLFFNIILSILIIILIKRYVKDSLESMVNYDSLTNIYNRRYFSEYIHQELIRCERYNRVFSLIMFDIDFFKQVNDKYGHDVGDKVLIELSTLANCCIRKSDVLARVGGEEFAIIALETGLADAMSIAEKLRQQVEKASFVNNLKITISLGVSQYQSKDDENTVFKRADNALYKAKANGRNRIEAGVEEEKPQTT